jgi:hypothetical protein
MLRSEANEVQDLTTILNSLFIYQHKNPKSPGIDLAEALNIPGLKTETFIVETPPLFEVENIRYKITTTEVIAAMKELVKARMNTLPLRKKVPGKTGLA